MARVLGKVDSKWGYGGPNVGTWIWVLLTAFCVSTVILAQMAAKKKSPAKKRPGPEAESSRAAAKKGVKEIERRDEEMRKKRKNDKEEKEDKEHKRWVAKLKNRKFTCERQLIRDGLPDTVLVAIYHQGLSHFYEEVRTYRPRLVRSFYESMEMHDDPIIESKIGDVTVVVTPDSIANYLGCARPLPSNCTYPVMNWPVPLDEVIRTITDDARSFDPGFNRYTSGGLKLHYRVMNKVVSYNLDPFSREKTPSKSDGDVIYVVGSDSQVCDWALFIFHHICIFRNKGGGLGNIPFPIMITHLCTQAGCRPSLGDNPVVGSPGPITMSSIKKSSALSKTIDPDLPGPSRPSQREATQARHEKMLHALVGRQHDLLQNQNRIENEQKKRDGKMMKMLRWLICGLEETSGKKFVETESEKSDEDEELGVEEEEGEKEEEEESGDEETETESEEDEAAK